MATWSVKPEWKKSIIERNYLVKDDNTVMIETGWRWGEFLVYTEDDNPPEIEAGVDIYNCGYESELVETDDGCWEEHDFDDCDDETREWLEEFLDENSWLDLEEHGWIMGDCEMIIDCDLIIERIDGDYEKDDGPLTVDQTNQVKESIKLEPTAEWPFSNVNYAEFVCEKCDFSTTDIGEVEETEEGEFVCPKCGSKVNL